MKPQKSDMSFSLGKCVTNTQAIHMIKSVIAKGSEGVIKYTPTESSSVVVVTFKLGPNHKQTVVVDKKILKERN